MFKGALFPFCEQRILSDVRRAVVGSIELDTNHEISRGRRAYTLNNDTKHFEGTVQTVGIFPCICLGVNEFLKYWVTLLEVF